MWGEVVERRFSRTGYAVISWNYTIAGPPEGIDIFDNAKRAMLFGDLILHITKSLKEFAEIEGIDVCTDSPDDAKYELKKPKNIDLAELDKNIRSTFDISDIYVWFNLTCVTRKLPNLYPVSREIWDGWISIHNYINDNGVAESDDSLINVSFEFHNVIYSPAELSEDYLRQAELDALALSSFVRRLERFPHLMIKNIDHNSGYDGWLNKHGLAKANQYKLPE